ncbi:anti-sigma factor [Paenibacillus protaetiae]|nr:anti-sigma factor [Paenibacillus protaetiae]
MMAPQQEASCKLGYGEESWIDWLLGKFSDRQNEAMAAHLAHCGACRSLVELWGPLLEAGIPEHSGAGSGMAAEPQLPSDQVRRKLRRRVQAAGMMRRFRSGWTVHKRWAAAAVSAVVVLLCAAALYNSVRQPADQRNAYVARHEPGAASFMNDPETASYKVHPYNDELGEGYVWYNGNSSEMLVMLEGMLPSDDYDIQAWALEGGHRTNLGLLAHLEQRRAYLFIKGHALDKASRLALTIEPSGGSDTPTSPDAFLFQLQR